MQGRDHVRTADVVGDVGGALQLRISRRRIPPGVGRLDVESAVVHSSAENQVRPMGPAMLIWRTVLNRDNAAAVFQKVFVRAGSPRLCDIGILKAGRRRDFHAA